MDADNALFWEFPVVGGLVVACEAVEDEIYFLNHTAGFIWAAVRSGMAEDRVAAHFAVAFGVSHERALADVRDALESWGGWFSRGRFYELNGKRFRLLLESDELEAEILLRLEHLSASPGLGGADFCLRRKEEESVSKTRALLLQEMVRLARGGGEWLALLHAGACATARGCVVFPAPSGSGKTTLAAALMLSGLGCHGDDSVGVESGSLTVPPMPFALAVREGSWPVVSGLCPGFAELPVRERFGQRVRYLAPLLPGGRPVEAVPAVGLVFPRFEAGTATTVTRMGMLEALVGLKEAGFWVPHSREGIQAFLDWVAGLPAWRLVYSDVGEAVAVFRELLASDSH